MLFVVVVVAVVDLGKKLRRGALSQFFSGKTQKNELFCIFSGKTQKNELFCNFSRNNKKNQKKSKKNVFFQKRKTDQILQKT